ncbi:gephyrin-like molybdotransferase Glp [Magnetospira sp. QH-2]|uniref:molybdopterin molybdotransferase MoeA n=1 Tax=Magnetospira sp. (strain QH-2) TaxID=1288970 RepID=UPI0003E81341|nr:gephyrin-like molybdotransferase Glp [Magnetospira sp. QH-2]CCQ73127.1 Molybdopterin biosynthesis protein MoeA [Magnetospira sp. QH-2]
MSSSLMPLEEALDKALAGLTCVCEMETLVLGEAQGRVLAEDVIATRHVPPADNSAMDGFAVRRADLSQDLDNDQPVVGESLAGNPFNGPLAPGAAVRIATGALIPSGADTVIMQEYCTFTEESGSVILSAEGVRKSPLAAHIRRRGEDVAAGSILLTAGTILRPQELGVLAAQGVARIPVRKKLRVAVFSTGDELHEPHEKDIGDSIYDSNRHMLMGLLSSLGCAVNDLGILPDRLEIITDALDKAAKDNDLLITSGGVSVGKADFVKPAVEALGEIDLWRMATKPGKPVMKGRIGDAMVLGLPGNPVAVMVSFLQFSRPLMLRMMGAVGRAVPSLKVPAAFEFKRKPGRREWLRARLTEDGARAEIFPLNSSGALTSLSWADGLVELPEACTAVTEGETVTYIPLSGFSLL